MVLEIHGARAQSSFRNFNYFCIRILTSQNCKYVNQIFNLNFLSVHLFKFNHNNLYPIVGSHTVEPALNGH